VHVLRPVQRCSLWLEFCSRPGYVRVCPCCCPVKLGLAMGQSRNHEVLLNVSGNLNRRAEEGELEEAEGVRPTTEESCDSRPNVSNVERVEFSSCNSAPSSFFFLAISKESNLLYTKMQP
jgi:hypothetical protein